MGHHIVSKIEMDNKAFIVPEDIVKEGAMPVSSENITAKVEEQNEVHNKSTTKTVLSQKEMAENMQHNYVSRVTNQDANRSYFCDKCNYKANRNDNLTQHIKAMHEGEKYPCDKCNYKATFKTHLRMHIKSIHEGH